MRCAKPANRVTRTRNGWVALSVLAAGCATTPGTSTDWAGKDLAQVVAIRGAPAKTVSLAHGNMLYFFPRRQQFVDFSDPIPRLIDVDSRGILYVRNEPAYLLQGDSLTMRCRSDVFVIGPDHKVVSWRGFAC